MKNNKKIIKIAQKTKKFREKTHTKNQLLILFSSTMKCLSVMSVQERKKPKNHAKTKKVTKKSSKMKKKPTNKSHENENNQK